MNAPPEEAGAHQRTRVSYSADLMEEIRAYVMAGFHSFPRGGLEVGGLLFGRRDGERIQIQAWRPVDCEHACGPRFLLSDKDEAGLAQALHTRGEASRKFEAVGAFRSTRADEVSLEPADIAFQHRHLPYSSRVALVLRPSNFKPLRARFFERGSADDRFEEAGPEFAVRPRVRADSKVATTPQRPDPPAPALDPERAWPRLRWWKVTTVALSLVLVASAGATALGWFEDSGPRELGLNAAGRDGQLQIVWDARPRAVRQGDRGLLEIVSGSGVTRVALDSQELRRGNLITGQAEADDMQLSMTVYRRGRVSVKEVTRFVVAPRVPQTSSDGAQDRAQAADRLTGELRHEKLRVRRPQPTKGPLWKQRLSAGIE